MPAGRAAIAGAVRIHHRDSKTGESRVVVISYDLWQRRFGGDPNIIGRKITLNNQPNEVIGVLPAEVGWYVQKGSMISKPPQIWSPWQISDELRGRRGRFARAVARLKPGVTFEQAQNEMNVIGARLEQQFPEFNAKWGDPQLFLANASTMRPMMSQPAPPPIFCATLGKMKVPMLVTRGERDNSFYVLKTDTFASCLPPGNRAAIIPINPKRGLPFDDSKISSRSLSVAPTRST